MMIPTMPKRDAISGRSMTEAAAAGSARPRFAGSILEIAALGSIAKPHAHSPAVALQCSTRVTVAIGELPRNS